MRHVPLLVMMLALASGCDGSGDAPSPTTSPAVTAPAPATSSAPSSAPSQPPAGPEDPLSPMPPVEPPAPSPTGPTCSASDITVADADSLADQRRLEEVFAIRTSGSPCRLRGWPQVTLLDTLGDPIAVTARRTGTAGELSLTRTSSLSFDLTTPRTTDCEDVSAVLVTLPGTDRALRVETGMQVCSATLDVGPVERRQETD